MVAHAFSPSTWKAETGGSLQGQSGLQSEFQNYQGYTEKPWLKKQPKFFITIIIIIIITILKYGG